MRVSRSGVDGVDEGGDEPTSMAWKRGDDADDEDALLGRESASGDARGSVSARMAVDGPAASSRALSEAFMLINERRGDSDRVRDDEAATSPRVAGLARNASSSRQLK